MRNVIVLTFAGLLAVPLAGLTQAGRPRIPISTTEVARTISSAGLLVTSEQIQMPVEVTATGQQPDLEIVAAELRAGGAVRVRLVCKQEGTCQPFFVSVSPAQPQAGLAAITALQHRVPLRPVLNRGEDGRVFAGQHTTLLLEDSHMQITVPVIAIDTGSAGAQIRVSSLDRRQTFQAVVIAGGIVRGTLP